MSSACSVQLVMTYIITCYNKTASTSHLLISVLPEEVGVAVVGVVVLLARSIEGPLLPVTLSPYPNVARRCTPTTLFFTPGVFFGIADLPGLNPDDICVKESGLS